MTNEKCGEARNMISGQISSGGVWGGCWPCVHCGNMIFPGCAHQCSTARPISIVSDAMFPEPQRTAVKCPVCNGEGDVRKYAIGCERKTCHGCGGKGWV